MVCKCSGFRFSESRNTVSGVREKDIFSLQIKKIEEIKKYYVAEFQSARHRWYYPYAVTQD
ncbi:hypothetical protein DS742_25975 [Lacrimispora amygdalina]|uniref:Uncharacterized protein n=1 Tax=Lacrimispora amygdalina TaxID=253257 RepID=A0A3E2N4X4_9FIRM|nr:hypothetical protein DS742_25975 [Clostridium indicum]